MTTSLVLLNARLWSPDGAGMGCDAIVADGGRITALTTTAQARAQVGPGTRVIDLGGRLAIPAFGDAHVHPVGGGLESLRCDLTGPRDRARYLRVIADCARTLGPDDWVLGGGWSMEAFPGGVPPAADLVEAAGGRPVFLPNRDHHSAWVSPAALARAGVTRDTPDPPDGRIERDSAGEPSGTLHDGAMRLVSRLIAPPTPDELAAGLRAGQRHLHALGITHWQDAIVGEAPDIGIPDALDTYRRAAAEGWLTGRVNGALWWDRRRGLEQIPDLLARREQAGTGVFQATSVKLMLDGVCETLTAAMTEPYTAPRRRFCGQARPGMPPGTLTGATCSCRGRRPPRPSACSAARVSRSICTPSATEPSTLPSMPWPPPPARAHPRTCATTSRTCSSSGPRTWTASPTWAWWPTSSPCGPPTNRRWTSSRCPSSARNGPAGST